MKNVRTLKTKLHLDFSSLIPGYNVPRLPCSRVTLRLCILVTRLQVKYDANRLHSPTTIQITMLQTNFISFYNYTFKLH